VHVLAVVHERDAGSGVFADAAATRGDEVVEWVPAEAPPPPLDGFGAALVFGGGMHVDHEQAHPWLGPEKELLRSALARRMPVLGVCLGAQLLAEVAGGSARPAPAPEIGWKQVALAPHATEDPVLGALPAHFESFQWHSYEVTPPPGAVALAYSAACLQAFRLEAAPWWGIQFHAEVTHETVAGWLRDYGDHDDAARAALDREAVLAQTAVAIAGWNKLGMGICARFLERATRA
jgi:GMP synthase-like glutamine amidotransferase